MMTIIKRFSFWFIILSILICFFNLSGSDDYNLIIFITNPISWFFENWLTKINTNPDTTVWFRPILYLLHIAFWAILGHLIDFIRVRVRNNRKNDNV